MSEKRPRISTETLDRLAHVVGTSDSVAVDDPENTSVERQVKALTEAYVRSARERRELALRLDALEQQRQQQTQSDTLFPSSRQSSAPGRSSSRGRRR